MEKSLYYLAEDFFKKIKELPMGQKELSRFDRVLKFRSIDSNDSFSIEVKDGQLKFYNELNDIIISRDKDLLIESNFKTFINIFKCKEAFMDVWYSNRLRVVPLLGNRWIAGWFFRLIYIGQQRVISNHSPFNQRILL